MITLDFPCWSRRSLSDPFHYRRAARRAAMIRRGVTRRSVRKGPSGDGRASAVRLRLAEHRGGRRTRSSRTCPVGLRSSYVPNGVNMAHWRPEKTGTRLRAHLDSRTARQRPRRDARPQRPDLRQGPGRTAMAGDHARSLSAFLTARQPLQDARGGHLRRTSIDQVAAERIGAQTRFLSLEDRLRTGASVGRLRPGL